MKCSTLKLPLSVRSFVLCCYRRSLGRGSATQAYIKRNGYSCRYEEPHGRRYVCYAELYPCGTGKPYIYIQGLGTVTSGNPLAHAILRGAVNKHGQTIPNYHYEDLSLLYELYCKKNLQNMAVIVDTNHSNSGKKYLEQVRIANEILHSRRHSKDLEGFVKGLMIESYIEDGSQSTDDAVYGKSITDRVLAGKRQKSSSTA